MKAVLVLLSCLILASPSFARAGKGIFNCGGYPRGADYGRTDPNVAGKEIMFEWREIEPEDGVYNWKLIDDEIKPWADAGKVVAIRIMSACNDGSASPMWLFEKCGVPMVDSTKYSASSIIFPVFWNATFERKHAEMVRELAKRYDGHPNVEFVQVSGVGRWEETYVHTENDAMSKRWQELGYTHERYIAHCKRMVDVYLSCFRKTPVLLSISIGGPDPKTSDRKPIGYALADYAVKHGLYIKQNGMGSFYSYTDHDHFSRIFTDLRGKAIRAYEQGAPVAAPYSWERSTVRSDINRALIDCPDYLWIYECDLGNPAFAKDVEFAAKHLSMKSYRDAGPLYIRFKQLKGYHTNPNLIDDEFYGLINRWSIHPWPEKSKLEPATIDGVECKTTSPEFPYVYLDLEDSAIIQESGGSNFIKRGTMDITFWDEGTDEVTAEYNHTPSGFASKASFARTNEKRWRTVRVVLEDMKFETTLSVPEQDFRISAGDGKLAVEKVTLGF